MSFKIVRNDITRMHTQAIVNTANEYVMVGPGCDSAIYNAAGYDQLLAYRKENIGEVPEGEAFITPGFNLRAEYIIHAVSPLYVDGAQDEEEKLRSCYQKSLQLALDNSITSIAFPIIATGGFGYPKEEGLRIAVDEVSAFLLKNDMMIYLVVFDDRTTTLGGKLYPRLEEYIDQKYVEKKRADEYEDFCFGDTAPRPESSEQKLSQALSKPAENNRFGGRRLRRKESLYEDAAGVVGAAPGNAAGMVGAAPAECCMAASMPVDAEEAAPLFEEKHESKLAERMKHLSDTFSEYLLYLIRTKKMENAEVYKRAIVDKKTFSKIKNNPDYHPQKLTALCLCVGAKLNLDESRDLLARAGYALSPCDKTDIIFSFFIENKIYDMIELDIQLEEHGLPCIIT